MKPIQGRIWKYGNNINTDVIFPGKYTYTITDPDEMRAHALEDLDPTFASKVKPGDVIVAGANWGSGSSREQAVTCIKASGVGAIIAASFARIYYRNCINAALPALTCSDILDQISNGEKISIDLDGGIITVAAGQFQFSPIPPAVKEIFTAGGLIPYTRNQLNRKNS